MPANISSSKRSPRLCPMDCSTVVHCLQSRDRLIRIYCKDLPADSFREAAGVAVALDDDCSEGEPRVWRIKAIHFRQRLDIETIYHVANDADDFRRTRVQTEK
jgi:hypothetical protein